MTVSKSFYSKSAVGFLIRCILDYAQCHLVDFWKKRPANFNFIWLEWNSYNSSIQIHIVWSRSSIFKLKSSPAQGCTTQIMIIRTFVLDFKLWRTATFKPVANVRKNCIPLGVVLKLRWPIFQVFWPPTYTWLTFLKDFLSFYVVKSMYRWHFTHYLPTSSCQRSFWMTP